MLARRLILPLLFLSTALPVWADPKWIHEQLLSPEPHDVVAVQPEIEALSPQDRRALVNLLTQDLIGGSMEARRIARALAYLGPAAEPALPALIASLNSDDQATVTQIHDTVMALSPDLTIRPLIQGLSEDSYAVRKHVLEMLGELGPRAASAVPAVVEHLSDTHYEVQTAAEAALQKFGPAALPGLKQTLSQSVDAVRQQIVKLLPQYGSDAIPLLLQTLKKDPAWFVRASAIEGLLQLQTPPKEFVAALRNILKEPNDRLHLAAIDALAELGKEASPALDDLKFIAATDKDSLIHQKSLDAINAITSAHSP